MHADTEDIYVSKIIFIACEEEGQTSTLKSAARVQVHLLISHSFSRPLRGQCHNIGAKFNSQIKLWLF